MSGDIPDYEFCNDQIFDEQIRERLDALNDHRTLTVGYSGNPFVDAGLIAISVIKNKGVHEATLGDLIDVFRSIGGSDTLGKDFAERNAATKSSFMIFPNNPLTQPAYGRTNTTNQCLKKPSGGRPSPLQRNVYRAYLAEFIHQIPKEANSEHRCISCGRETTFDFNELELRLEEVRTGETPTRRFGKGITKSWFPLIGTIGNEAQALPAFSEPQMICARCLFLVHFLPQITHLMQGKLVVYQSDNFAITKKLIESNLNRFEDVFSASSLERTIEIVGKNDPPSHMILKLLDILGQFNEDLIGSTLIIWQFTNSAQGSECETYFLPDRTLNFLRLLSLNADFNAEQQITRFVQNEERELRHPDRFLLTRIIRAEDYEGFYVKSTVEPPNVDFYNFYQMYFLGWTPDHLKAVRVIVEELKSRMTEKNISRFYTNWKTKDILDLLFPQAIKLQFEGEINYQIILELFFSESPHDGGNNSLNLFRFYFHPKQDGNPKSKLVPMSTQRRFISENLQNRIELVALLMESHIYRKKIDLNNRAEKEKFLKEVDRYNLDNIRNLYLSISNTMQGLTYEQFRELKEGITRRELLYLFRILTRAILNGHKVGRNHALPKVKDLADLVRSSGMSDQLCNALIRYSEVRINKIGKDRFFREFDDGLKRGKISSNYLLNQINERLRTELEQPVQIPEADWFEAGFGSRTFFWKLLKFKLRIFFYQFRIWTETNQTKEE